MRRTKETVGRKRSASHGGEQRAPHLMAVISDPIVARDWVEPKRCETQHNSLCEICRKFFPNHKGSTMYCIYCNVMCHVQCMTKFQKNLIPPKEWICFYCIDYLDDSKERHKQKQSDNINLTKYTNAQIIIAKYWRRFAERRFYVKIYNLIVYLQVKFRVNKRKQAFHKQVQSKLRPFHLRITKCSNMNLDLSSKRAHKTRKDSAGAAAQEQEADAESHFIYVIATVLDFSKGHLSQTWRVTTELVSVDHGSHHAFAGTAGADSKNTAANSGTGAGADQAQSHALGIIRHHNHHHHHAPKHVHFDCAFLLGGVSGYQFVVLSVFQRGSFSRDLLLGQAYVDLSAGMVWKRGGSFVKGLETQDFAVKDHMGADMKVDCKPRPEGTIEFELHPVQGLCSGCGIIYAPCTEDLVRMVSLQGRFPGFTLPKTAGSALERRKYAVGGNSSGYSHSAAIHVKKSWVAIADGKIYMYSHFGDSLKIRINVEHFSFYATIRNRTVVYILRAPEFPDLEFYTSSKEEELRWKCAFLSTFRYKQSGTMSVTGADSYDTHSLIRDLALVEVNRYSGKDEQLLHFYSPTTNGGGGTISTKFGTAGNNAKSTVSNFSNYAASNRNARRADESPSRAPVAVTFKDNYKDNYKETNKETNKDNNKDINSKSPPQAAPPIKSILSTASITSSSSCSSLGETSIGSHSPAGANVNAGPKRVLGGGGMRLNRLSSSVSTASTNSRTVLKKGLFAEIDMEIAHIQEVKSKYRKEYKEDRRKRAVAVAIADAHSEGGDGHSVSSHGRHVTLQGVREQVHNLFEAEENALNDKVNSVGANFVTRILTAMKQKKMH